MFASRVVVLEPWLQSSTPFVVGSVDAPVRPFRLEGSVEALNFAVLPGTVRPDPHMPGTQVVEDVSHGVTVGV